MALSSNFHSGGVIWLRPKDTDGSETTACCNLTENGSSQGKKCNEYEPDLKSARCCLGLATVEAAAGAADAMVEPGISGVAVNAATPVSDVKETDMASLDPSDLTSRQKTKTKK